MSNSIADIRKDYKQASLLEHNVSADPFQQFSWWWNEALESDIDEVNAMTLATATKQGIPSARIVLLKGFSDQGFVFFTNYNSHKGKELEENPSAALVFFWKELERQVRIEGIVQKIQPEESDEYYNSRPLQSRIGAWASPQSQPITRQYIDDQFQTFEKEFRDGEVKRPPHWGGYRVIPRLFEFWQGRPSRLHDRIQYTSEGINNWNITRLAP